MREREGRDYYSRMDGLIRTVRTACDAIATRDAMAAKAAVATIRLVIPAGKATPQPPVGSALGQRGLNIMQFCKDFNDRTSTYEALVPVPVVITAFKDRSFTFVMKTPPVSYFLKKAAGITAGSSKPGTDVAGEISLQAVYEIARVKKTDASLAHIPLESLAKSILGTARSMGLTVRSATPAAGAGAAAVGEAPSGAPVAQ